MIAFADQLRSELNPFGQLEEMFFSQLVNLATLAAYLMRHLEADPELIHKETPRRMRMLASNQRQARYAYEELRRLQLARQMQQEDPELAGVPLLAIVARNTNRNGYRAQRRAIAALTPAPNTATSSRALAANAAPVAPNAAMPSRPSAANAAPVAPITRPVTPGRNAQCPCGSGAKYKRCCANKEAAA